MPDDMLPVPDIDATWIEQRIFVLRGQKVMFDTDLAILYGVPTKALNQQVRRNIARFPDDFLLRLTPVEVELVERSRSQIVTLNAAGRGKNIKYAPYAFTEHGVTMLSAVLRSARAIAVSIAVVRAFVRLRYVVAAQTDLVNRVDSLEQRSTYHDGQLTVLFDTVHQLLAPDEMPAEKPAIGFIAEPNR